MNPNSLLIGFRDTLKLTIYLDYQDNEAIYICHGVEYKFTRAKFEQFMNFLRVSNQVITDDKLKGPAGIISPKSMTKQGFIWLQDNGYIKIEWQDFIKVLTQENYFIFVEEMEISTQNLDRYDKIKYMTPEARAALGIDEVGRPLKIKDKIYTLRLIGYAIVCLMAFLDAVLLVAGIFNPTLLFLVAIIFLMIILSYLLLPQSEKVALKQFRANFRQFMEEDFLRIVQALPISRKSVELFIILIIVMTFMTAYFSKAIPSILSWGKKLFGEVKPELSAGDDVLKMMSYNKKNGGAYYDPDKKFSGTSQMFKHFINCLYTSKVTLKRMNANINILFNFNYYLEGEIATQLVSCAQDFKGKLMGFRQCVDAKVEPFGNNYAFKAYIEFPLSSPQFFKRFKPPKSVDKKVIDEIVRRNIYVILGKNAYMQRGSFILTTVKEKKVFEKGFMVNFQNFDQVLTFVTLMEADHSCLEVLVDEMIRDNNGYYDVKFRVILISMK